MKRLIIFLFISTILFAQERILIDEDFSDWENITAIHSDPPDDGTGGNANIDFRDFWVANDDDYLYFRIQSGREITLVDYAFATNYMYLFIDTDNDPNTGKSINGIGAELEYSLANRRGKTYINGEQNISHSDIGFLGAPTFSAKQFEFAIKRNVTVNGSPLFPNDNIKIMFAAFTSSSLDDAYDFAPDQGGFDYEFADASDDPFPEYSIRKTNPGYLRVMAYNIEQDGIVDQGKTTEFHHIFDAIEPEIIGFSEVYDASSQQVADRLEFFLPSGEGQGWYNKKEGAYDIVIVSRFQIKQSFTINSDVGHDASGAFLLDLRPKYDSDMLVIVSHPKAFGGRENDDKRQNQFDAIIAFLRDAVNSGGELTIQPNIPIVIMGDMNLVGDSRQYETLITGDIRYNGNYGDDFAPDWDGGNLDDAKPYVTNTNMTYTTNPGSFPPGRLDFIVYSGSVMEVVNSYVLNSKELDSSELSQSGLSPNDTEVSDHLPVVTDFDLSPITEIKKKDDAPKKFGLMQNYPNPFNPTTLIKFNIPLETAQPVVSTELTIYDILGREVKTLINEHLQPGSHKIEFNAADLPSGVYYYSLTTGQFSSTKKMVLIR